MKKILITGVAGMIGSHLADRLLKSGYSVIGIDNLDIGSIANIEHNLKDKKFTFIKADILKPSKIKKCFKNVDIIVHLAACKKIGENGNALKTLTVNTEGTRNILELAKPGKIKVIFASTSDVYGVSKDLPFREDGNLEVGSPTAKRWAYAVSKIFSEQLVFGYFKEFKVPVVIIRYFGGFSPRASFSWSGGHIPLFIDAVLSNREVIIHGDGLQTRSMAYVDDLVDGTILAMENPKAVGEIFNIGNNEEISVIDSARVIHKLAGTGRKLKIKFVPQKKIFGAYTEITRRVPDLAKAKRILGYEPKIKFKEAVKITLSAYRKRA